jgi:hypothetical protein
LGSHDSRIQLCYFFDNNHWADIEKLFLLLAWVIWHYQNGNRAVCASIEILAPVIIAQRYLSSFAAYVLAIAAFKKT